MSGRILLLTGERGVGKTTVCREAVARARAAGWVCAGLLTLRVGDERDAMDVRSGERRRLTTAAAGVRQGRFTFDPGTLAWGAEVLGRAMPCDLLVVDELGPLEIERGQGWAVALDLLREGAFRLALVVVRPELTARVQCLLHPADIVAVTPRNRGLLPGLLVEKLR